MSNPKKLTERTLKSTPPPATGQALIWDSGAHRVTGFGARITPAGTVSFILDYRIHGRKRRYTIGRWPAWSVSAAREQAARLAREVDTGADPLEKRAHARAAAANTLGKYLDSEYKRYQKTRKSGPQTVATIGRSFARLINRPLQSLTERDIDRWREAREAEGLKFATIKRHFDALQGLLNHAVKKKTIHANPLAGVRLDKPAATAAEHLEAETVRKILTHAEIDRLFAGLEAFNELKREQRRRSRRAGKKHLPDMSRAAYCHAAVPWLRLAYFTGFRPGDLFGLRWEHVDFERAQIRKVIEKTAAHNGDPRTFPLSPAALETLADWAAQHGHPATGFVFRSARTGGRMDKHSMQKPWKLIKRLAGLPAELGIYTLRHNYASQLIAAGADLYAVSRLLAHSEITTTIRNYAHLAPDQARALVEQIPRAT